MTPTRRDFLAGAAALGTLALQDDWLARVEAAVNRAGARPPEALAGDESFWFEVQQAFAVDRSVTNLNNGGVSPSPRVVQDALRRHLEFANQLPAYNQESILKPQVETVRRGLARAFGCDAEEMAITRNASESLEICLLGFDLEPGDEVLTTTHDYPRMLTTLKQREARDGIKLVQVEIPAPARDPGDIVEAFARAVTPKTRLILCSHVVFVTGQILPVREICRLGRELDIPVIVDGAHAFAHFPFTRDELGCDYYGTSLHKWLTACFGTGFLSVRKEKIAPLWPLMAAPETLAADIRKFEEIGTHPYANKLAISEALALHNAIGPERKAARLRFLRDRWAQRLAADRRVSFYTRLEPEHCCGIATLRVEALEMDKLQRYLWERHRILTVFINYNGVVGLRVSPNVYTTVDEVDAFAAAVEEVLARGLPA